MPSSSSSGRSYIVMPHALEKIAGRTLTSLRYFAEVVRQKPGPPSCSSCQ